MNSNLRIGSIALLALIGLWGCSRATSGNRVEQLEARISKLEDDLKSTSTTRDTLKVRLAALEEQIRAESERAKMIERERDELTAKLNAKAAEKDQVLAQYDDLVKKLEAVLGHAKVTQSKLAVPQGQVPATVTSMPRQ